MSSEEMDEFEKIEMMKNRSQLENALNKWYDWLFTAVNDLNGKNR